MTDEPVGDELTIEINADAITWADMRLFFTLGDKISGKDAIELAASFDRVVVGGAAAVPVNMTFAAVRAIAEAVKGLGNPKA